LGAGQCELALLGIAPGLEPSAPLLEKDALPALKLMDRHLALARHRVERFAPQESQDQFRLPLGAPAFGELDLVRWTGWLRRCRRLPRLRPMSGLLGHGHPNQLRVPRNRVRFRLVTRRSPRGTAID